MDLESRVDKLEEKVEDLSVIPMKLDILIGLQQENNRTQRELSAHIGETYVTKDLCTAKHESIIDFIAEFKDFRKYIYASIIAGLFSIATGLSVMVLHFK